LSDELQRGVITDYGRLRASLHVLVRFLERKAAKRIR